ncbi:MAG: hypothetical protein JNM57_02345 [Cyclobacteriaceae bacterium]|nr:hypothetical protein [Cyclobacteriaceae bacterium]
MKKITIYFSCLLLSAVMGNVAYAQESGYPRPLTDKTVGDNLSKDWGQRNPGTQNPSVQWYDAGDGYYGTYNTGSTPYMTFYDRDGSYVQTYKKGDWNDVNSTLKSSFDGSTYKDQEVTGYWESSDPSKKGSYLEVKDDKGKSSRVWANEKGDLSPAFPKGKTTAKKPN